MTTKPLVISRDLWGADPPRGKYQPLRPQGIVLHHTAGPNGELSDSEEAKYQRSMQQSHFSRGWIDIGQHFTIMQSGRIYAGRPPDVRGSHAGTKANASTIGIEHQGTFLEIDPPPKLLEASVRLCSWLCSQFGIDPANITGHKDWLATACPGRLYNYIPEIRQRIQAKTKGRLMLAGQTSYLSQNRPRDALYAYVGTFTGADGLTYKGVAWLHAMSPFREIPVHVALFDRSATKIEEALWRGWLYPGRGAAVTTLGIGPLLPANRKTDEIVVDVSIPQNSSPVKVYLEQQYFAIK